MDEKRILLLLIGNMLVSVDENQWNHEPKLVAKLICTFLVLFLFSFGAIKT